MSIPGWATNDPAELCPCIRQKYDAFKAAADELGISVVTIETRRDSLRQTHYVKIGASRTLSSKHLGQPPHWKALAFDVAPREYLSLKGWNPGGPHWLELAKIGRSLGLRCGADFAGLNRGWDWPHFELTHCLCPLKEPEAA